jgi:hypothetical protein
MSTTLIEGDLLSVKVFCQDSTQVSITSLYYKLGVVVGGPITDSQMVGPLSTYMGTQFKTWLTVNSSYLGVRLQVLRDSGTSPYVPSTTGNGIGSALGDTLPPQVAGGIVKLTDNAARRYRGFVYVPFPGELYADDNGQVNGAGVTALGVLGLSILGTIALTNVWTAALDAVIWSKGKKGVDAPVIKPITSFRVQDWFVTRRSRGLNRKGDLLGP